VGVVELTAAVGLTVRAGLNLRSIGYRKWFCGMSDSVGIAVGDEWLLPGSSAGFHWLPANGSVLSSSCCWGSDGTEKEFARSRAFERDPRERYVIKMNHVPLGRARSLNRVV
jgi:hypothetical protein